MSIFLQLIKSLYSPKTMAAFRFQGIGKTILYVFFLVLVTSIPLFISFGTNAFDILDNLDESTADLDQLMVIFIVLGYIYFSGIKFVQISILAMFGLIIKKWTGRHNLQYRHLWLLSAYAVTLPTIIFSLLQAFQIASLGSETLYPIISFTICLFILFLVIKQVKVRKPQPPSNKM
ncbi:DUF1189 family protein [Sutcliffiella rhizosphaerae]|uniref:DUF1189 domain-containing protein n=1 Tax=Sutcliffiella rhizosphaerae TaxID=2880967 RepID=A0ABN8A884_9BACI|nr:DUF1189 family protein [Sutcliffiella rhizosphaerae]CAG9619323.1 hypothetical protein BACCIP111883_00090 [Sutcliffiella rhizosphaerae]